MELIASYTATGSVASIDFTGIPSTYTDLIVKLSARASNALPYNSSQLSFNNSTTGYSYTALWGNSTGAVSLTNTSTSIEWMYTDGANATADTFGNTEIYVPNYLSSNAKSVSFDNITENNAGTTNSVLTNLMAGLWSGTDAITSVKITAGSSANFVIHSTAYLYGVKNA